MRYLLAEIGCLECRNPTINQGVVDELPDGYVVAPREHVRERSLEELSDRWDVWRGESLLVAFEIES